MAVLNAEVRGKREFRNEREERNKRVPVCCHAAARSHNEEGFGAWPDCVDCFSSRANNSALVVCVIEIEKCLSATTDGPHEKSIRIGIHPITLSPSS